jgi:hypothetical protein
MANQSGLGGIQSEHHVCGTHHCGLRNRSLDCDRPHGHRRVGRLPHLDLSSAQSSRCAPRSLRGLLGLSFNVCMIGGQGRSAFPRRPTSRKANRSVIGIFVVYGVQQSIPASRSIQWQLPFIVQLAIPVLGFALSFLVPESPRFLLGRGKETATVQVLCRLRNLPEDAPYVLEECAAMKEAHSAEKIAKGGSGFLGLLKECFTVRNYFRRTRTVIIAYVLAQFSGANSISEYIALTQTDEDRRSLRSQLPAYHSHSSRSDQHQPKAALHGGVLDRKTRLPFHCLTLLRRSRWTSQVAPCGCDGTGALPVSDGSSYASIHQHAEQIQRVPRSLPAPFSGWWFCDARVFRHGHRRHLHSCVWLGYRASPFTLPLWSGTVPHADTICGRRPFGFVPLAILLRHYQSDSSHVDRDERLGSLCLLCCLVRDRLGVRIHHGQSGARPQRPVLRLPQIPETAGRSLESINALFDLKWYEIRKNAYPTDEDLMAPIVTQATPLSNAENGDVRQFAGDLMLEGKSESEHREYSP